MHVCNTVYSICMTQKKTGKGFKFNTTDDHVGSICDSSGLAERLRTTAYASNTRRSTTYLSAVVAQSAPLYSPPSQSIPLLASWELSLKFCHPFSALYCRMASTNCSNSSASNGRLHFVFSQAQRVGTLYLETRWNSWRITAR